MDMPGNKKSYWYTSKNAFWQYQEKSIGEWEDAKTSGC